MMTMHYHYLGEELCPTGYTFSEYLNLLLKSRGYLYWQTALCAESRGSPEARNFRTNMPVLFSDFEESDFVPKMTAGTSPP